MYVCTYVCVHALCATVMEYKNKEVSDHLLACMYVCTYVCMYVHLACNSHGVQEVIDHLLVCMYICTCVCMYVCTPCVQQSWSIRTKRSAIIYLHVCTYVRMYVCIYVHLACNSHGVQEVSDHLLVCMYICTCVCMYVCTPCVQRSWSIRIKRLAIIYLYVCMYVRMYVYTYILPLQQSWSPRG
jgi:hypothetical protein